MRGGGGGVMMDCFIDKYVLKDTVTKDHENDEIEAVKYASAVNTTTWLDSVVHHFIPVLSGEDLPKQM